MQKNLLLFLFLFIPPKKYPLINTEKMYLHKTPAFYCTISSINLIYLYKFYSFSKNLFLILLILSYAQSLFSGLILFEPLGYILDDLVALSQGAILTLLFLTPLKERFLNK